MHQRRVGTEPAALKGSTRVAVGCDAALVNQKLPHALTHTHTLMGAIKRTLRHRPPRSAHLDALNVAARGSGVQCSLLLVVEPHWIGALPKEHACSLHVTHVDRIDQLPRELHSLLLRREDMVGHFQEAGEQA